MMEAELEQLEARFRRRHAAETPKHMPSMLENQVAVVSGASGGIGRAVALELARSGADVVAHANRHADQAELVADEIIAIGRQATVLRTDLGDAASCEAFAAFAWNWKSRVDVLVNVAGADVLTGEAADGSF